MIQIDHVTFSYGEETEHTGGVRDIELQITVSYTHLKLPTKLEV